MSITKVANSEIKGFENLGEWTEPEFSGTEVQVIAKTLDQFVIDEALQNRSGIEKNDYGFIATSSKTDEIGKYFISQAERGIASEDSVPPITIGRLDDKLYLIGGHGRLSGLMHARKACGNGHLELFADPNAVMKRRRMTSSRDWALYVSIYLIVSIGVTLKRSLARKTAMRRTGSVSPVRS